MNHSRYFIRQAVAVSAIIACLFLSSFCGLAWGAEPPPPPASGQYGRSAHGSNIVRATANGYSVGNCYHCHEMHASYQGTTPAPAAGSPDIYLGAESEEDLCLGCHDAGGAVGTATDDIDADIDKAYGHGTGPTNLLTMFQSGRHRANETTVTGVVSTAHVECTDCHNPHVARSGNHTKGSNLITGPSPLEGVSGVDFSAYPSTWANLTSWGAAGANAYATATKEYQICFKCHSSANSDTDDWDGNPGDAREWTDVALEFNTANQSYHPVVAATRVANRILGSPGAAQELLGGWSLGQTMYCSDCHQSDSAIAGPHGSAVKWMLAGVNKAWPYTTAANNGTNGSANFRTYALRNTDLGTSDGLFCRNCHAVGAGVHSAALPHQSVSCLNCHIRVPHGGKLARLITTNSAGLPSRYYPDGQGGGFVGGYITGYTDYGTAAASCYQSGCAGHTAGPGLSMW